MTPARRVALALGAPACLALTAWGAFSIVGAIGQGPFPVYSTIPVTDGRVTAHFAGGNVLLEQGAVGEARLTGTAHYSLIRPAFTAQRVAGGVDFGYNCDLPVGNCGLDATVSVPVGTATTISTGVTAGTGGGDIQIEFATVPGNVHVTSDGGNITIIVPRGATQYNVTASSDGGSVADPLPINTSSQHAITATTGGGNVTIREAP